jgi:hypothetical protein
MTAAFRSVGNVNLLPFIASFEITKDADKRQVGPSAG